MKSVNYQGVKIHGYLLLGLIFICNLSHALSSNPSASGGLPLPDVLCSDVGGESCSGFIPDGEFEPVTNDPISLVSSFNFPTQCDQINDVDVYLNIEHGFLFQLSAFLTSPAGTEVELFDSLEEGKGGCTGENLLAYLDSDSSLSILGACNSGANPSISGVFRPNESLNGLNGQSGNGTWTLRVRDRLSVAGFDQGDLIDWGLNVDCTVNQGPSTPTPVPNNGFWALMVLIGLIMTALFFHNRGQKAEGLN